MNQAKSNITSSDNQQMNFKSMRSPIEHYAEANLPTEYGMFRVVVFRDTETNDEHLAIIAGEIKEAEDLLVRVHSECFTGEVLHSLKCDCREQLLHALKAISEKGTGMVIYLRQEGRGIGLGNKIKAYALQEAGHDTVDANRLLGFADDLRSYDAAKYILDYFDIHSISMLTNNPDKIESLEALGVIINKRLPIYCEPNAHSINYFKTKKIRMGHLFDESFLKVPTK